MLRGWDIVCISSIDWDFLWQNQQELTSRLAAAGNRVLYIENTGIRAPGLKDSRRVARRLKHGLTAWRVGKPRQIADNLYVYAPLVLPPFGSRLQRFLNRAVFLPRIAQAAQRLGMNENPLLLLTYLPTDTAVELIERLSAPRRRNGVALYYQVDNFAPLALQPTRLREYEDQLIARSDLIFATCEELTAHSRRQNNHVHIFPNGVDMESFPLMPKPPAPPDTAPTIGFVGGIAKFVDLELLIALARARPQWSWEFVGPVMMPAGELENLPNVKFFGQRPHSELAAHLERFDVCLIPYLLNVFTATVVPTKLNEYLAAGKAVVATKLPTVCRFNAEHEIIITADQQPEAFLRAIEAALKTASDPAEARRRRAVAALNAWTPKLEAMSSLIEAALSDK